MQVGLHFPTQSQSRLHGLPNLRVGIGAGGEIAVGLFLLRNHGHVRNADPRQNFLDAFQSRTVQGCIDHFQIQLFAIRQAALLNGIQEGFQTVFPNGDDLPGGPACFLGGNVHIREHIQGVDLFQNRRGNVQRDLTAVGAVDLVAVVL